MYISRWNNAIWQFSTILDFHIRQFLLVAADLWPKLIFPIWCLSAIFNFKFCLNHFYCCTYLIQHTIFHRNWIIFHCDVIYRISGRPPSWIWDNCHNTASGNQISRSQRCPIFSRLLVYTSLTYARLVTDGRTDRETDGQHNYIKPSWGRSLYFTAKL